MPAASMADYERQSAVRYEVSVDVTDVVGIGERLQVAATVVLPGDLEAARPRLVFFGFPGGGYNRRYFDLEIPGHVGYSQAAHHTERGHVFVACDHLGVGDSDAPTRPLDFEAVARANAHASREILARLSAGTIATTIPPVEVGASVALGQSYGGFLLIIGQGTVPVYDGVGVLGYSGLHTQTPWPPGLSLDDILGLRAGNGLRHPLRPYFHDDNVPEDIVVADMTKRPGSVGSAAPWSTSDNPGGPAVQMTRRPRDPGVVAVEAARIEVPVLVACGDIDVVADPWLEPTAYRGSRNVTVAVIPRMAHMHNFAATRRRLWELLDDWAVSVERTTSGFEDRTS